MLHRTGWPGYADPFFFHCVAGGVDIRNGYRQVAECIALVVVGSLIPVVGQFDNRVVLFITITDEGQRKPSGWEILLSQHLHAEVAAVKVERLFEILHPEHRMEKAELARIHACLGVCHSLLPYVVIQPKFAGLSGTG